MRDNEAMDTEGDDEVMRGKSDEVVVQKVIKLWVQRAMSVEGNVAVGIKGKKKGHSCER